MPHKHASSQNGFVFKNNKQYGVLTPEHGHLDCRGCTFTAQLTMFIAMNLSLQKLPSMHYIIYSQL